VGLLPPEFNSENADNTTYVYCNSTEAEMGKYASNLFGTMKVVFANIVYDYCQAFGIDYEKVKEIVEEDHRIGPSWLRTPHEGGRGAGGHCFPKDLSAMIKFGEERINQLGGHEGLYWVTEILDHIQSYNNFLLASTRKK